MNEDDFVMSFRACLQIGNSQKKINISVCEGWERGDIMSNRKDLLSPNGFP